MPFGTKKSRTSKQRRKTRQTEEVAKSGRRTAKRKKMIAGAIIGTKVRSARRKKRATAKTSVRKARRGTTRTAKSTKR